MIRHIAYCPIVPICAVLLIISGVSKGQSIRVAVGEGIERKHANSLTWRDVEHGGVNALYFMLRMNSRKCDYEQCLGATKGHPPRNLSEILAAAEHLGFAAEARVMSPEELGSLRFPAIVHLDGDTPAKGTFQVLLELGQERVTYLDGPRAAVSEIGREAFLRRWSGVVIVPSRGLFIGIARGFVALLSGIGIGVLLAFGWHLLKPDWPGTRRFRPAILDAARMLRTPWHMWRSRATLGVCLLAIGALMQTGVQGGQAQTGRSVLPEVCTKALLANVKAMGKVGLKYSIERNYDVKNLPRPIHEDHYIFLEDGQLYFQFARQYPPKKPGQSPRVSEEKMAFDGKVFYIWRKGGNDILRKLLGDNPHDPQAEATFVHAPYLEAAGFNLPRTVSRWRDSSLSSVVLDLVLAGKIAGVDNQATTLTFNVEVPEPAVVAAKGMDLDLLAKNMADNRMDAASAEHVISEYRRLQSLEWSRKITLTLDPTKGYAIVGRRDSNPEGKLIQTIDCDDFTFTRRSNLWLPRLCTVKFFVESRKFLDGFSETPHQTARIHLAEVEFSPREEVSFALSAGPGAAISERSTAAARAAPDGGITYFAPAKNQELRDAAHTGRGMRGFIFLIVNIVAVIILSLILTLRYRARKKGN